MGFLGYNIGKY